jgi:hypothetical protein
VNKIDSLRFWNSVGSLTAQWGQLKYWPGGHIVFTMLLIPLPLEIKRCDPCVIIMPQPLVYVNVWDMKVHSWNAPLCDGQGGHWTVGPRHPLTASGRGTVLQ